MEAITNKMLMLIVKSDQQGNVIASIIKCGDEITYPFTHFNGGTIGMDR